MKLKLTILIIRIWHFIRYSTVEWVTDKKKIPDYVNIWMKKTRKEIIYTGKIINDLKFGETRDHLKCKSGLTMSLQGGSCLYSEPKDYMAEKFSQVEMGFPSRFLPELIEYADVYEPKTIEDYSTVYAYVPVEILNKIIHRNGGIK